MMTDRISPEETHAFIFRQIIDGKSFFDHNAFEAFMEYAAMRGFSDAQILKMAESGMSSAEIFAAVESAATIE
jgi:hypothetical protein